MVSDSIYNPSLPISQKLEAMLNLIGIDNCVPVLATGTEIVRTVDRKTITFKIFSKDCTGRLIV